MEQFELRLLEKLEEIRNEIGIPFLTLTLWLSILIASIIAFTRTGNIIASTIMIVPPALILGLLLQNNENSTKQPVSMIPLIIAILWVYLSTLLVNNHSFTSNYYLAPLLSYILIIGIPLVILIQDNFWVRSGVDINKINRNFILILLLGGSISIGFLISSISQYNHPISESLLNELLIFVVYAPIFEELLFRGVIQDILEKRLGETFNAISITAFLFGLNHVSSYSHTMSNPIDLVLSLFVGPISGGLLYGYMKSLTDSTIPGIIAHSMINASMILGINLVEGSLFGLSIFILVILLLAIYAKYCIGESPDEYTFELVNENYFEKAKSNLDVRKNIDDQLRDWNDGNHL